MIGEGKRRNAIWNGTWNGMWNGMGIMQIWRRFFQDNLKLRDAVYRFMWAIFNILIYSYLGSQNFNQNPR